MKYLLVTLAAATLVVGCVRPPDEGDPSNARFVVVFDPVRSVSVDSWDHPRPLPASNAAGGTVPSEPPSPPTNASAVRIEGPGYLHQAFTDTIELRRNSIAYPARSHISLSYAFAIDNGCKDLAEKARREGRTLEVEGFGTVAGLAYAQVCYPGPVSGGGETASYYACPQPLPVETQIGAEPGQAEPKRPDYDCWCPPPLAQYFVRAERIVSCSLGGNATEPPTPIPSPLPPVEPQPAPLPNSN